MTEKSMIQITTAQARALLLIAPKNDARYFLCGVLAEFNTGRLVATDGKVLLGLRSEHHKAAEGPDSVIIPRDALETIAKGGKRGSGITVRADLHGGLTLIRDTGLEIATRKVDGNYPAYERAMPTTTSGKLAHFNPELVAKAAKALTTALGVNTSKTLYQFEHNGDGAAVLSWAGAPGAAVAIVMPFRVGKVFNADPVNDWRNGTTTVQAVQSEKAA